MCVCVSLLFVFLIIVHHCWVNATRRLALFLALSNSDCSSTSKPWSVSMDGAFIC